MAAVGDLVEPNQFQTIAPPPLLWRSRPYGRRVGARQLRVELRPGIKYLALRSISCGLVYDSQVPSGSNRPRPFIDRSEETHPA
jgi:hypothetical protein